MKKKITLTRKDGTWYATFHDCPETLRLFGADTLPTPYGETYPIEELLAGIRKLNPEHEVTQWKK